MENKGKFKVHKVWKSAFSYLFAFAASIAIYLVWSKYVGLDTRLYGADIYGHLYKIEMYRDALSANLDTNWYNGIIMFAAWPAGAYAFITSFCKDSINYFYLLCSALSAIPFVYLGNKKNRYHLGIFAGLVYPYIPSILKIELVEGNLAWYMAAVITPFIVVNVYVLLDKQSDRVRDYIVTAITGFFLYASLFAVHYMLAAITGLFLGLVVMAYIFGLSRRKAELGEKYVYRKSIISFAYLCIDGGFAGLMFITSIRSAMGNMGGEQSGYIWNHTIAESLLCSKQATFYYGLFILLISIAFIGICLSQRKKNKGEELLILQIFSFASPLFVIWCAIPVESYERVPLSSMLWPERFSALAVSAFLVTIIIVGDLLESHKSFEFVWIVSRVIIFAILIDCFLYARNVNIASYEDDMYTMIEGADRDNRTIILGPSPACLYVYYVGKTNTGWAYQGAANTEYLWTSTEAMKNRKYEYAMLKVLEQSCPDVFIDKKDCEGEALKNYIVEVAGQYGYKYVGESAEFIHLQNGLADFVSVVDYKKIAVGEWAPNFSLYVDNSYNALYINNVKDTLELLDNSGNEFDSLYIMADISIFDCKEVIESLKAKSKELIIDSSSLNVLETSFKINDVIFDCEEVTNYSQTYVSTVIANHNADSRYETERDGIIYLAQNPLELYIENGREITELYSWYRNHEYEPVSETESVPVIWQNQKTKFDISEEGICYLGITYDDKYLDWSVKNEKGEEFSVFSDAGIAAFNAVPGTYYASYSEKGTNLAKTQTYLFYSFYIGIILMILSGFLSMVN